MVEYVVSVQYPAWYQQMVKVEASSPEEACQMACETAGEREAWNGMDFDGDVFVGQVSEDGEQLVVPTRFNEAYSSHPALLDAAHNVIANWENGDLADAVRALDQVLAEHGLGSKAIEEQRSLDANEGSVGPAP